MILDVGCGNFPKGDVNCDISIKDVGHRTGRANKLTSPLHLQKIKNFVVCDALHLPFKDNAFDGVFSSHTIEHTINPFKFLKECVRVSSDRVTIVCPHRYGERIMFWQLSDFHFSSLSKTWFFKVAKKLHVIARAKYTQYVPLPLLHIFPLEIFVELRKPARIGKDEH